MKNVNQCLSKPKTTLSNLKYIQFTIIEELRNQKKKLESDNFDFFSFQLIDY